MQPKRKATAEVLHPARKKLRSTSTAITDTVMDSVGAVDAETDLDRAFQSPPNSTTQAVQRVSERQCLLSLPHCPQCKERQSDPDHNRARSTCSDITSGLQFGVSVATSGVIDKAHTIDLMDAQKSLPQLSTGLSLPEPPNLLEARVSLGDDSIVDDPLLRQTPFIVNSNYAILICLECRRVVHIDDTLKHIQGLHASCRAPPRFISKLKSKYPYLAIGPPQIRQRISPIFGLAIPLTQFYTCSRCFACFSQLPSGHGHPCIDTAINSNEQQLYFRSLGQTFSVDHHGSFFPISTPQVANTRSIDDYTLFKAQFDSTDAPGTGRNASLASALQLDEFLAKEGWQRHVSAVAVDVISAITAPPMLSEGWDLLGNETHALMVRIQGIIQQTGPFVQKLIGRRPPNNHDSVWAFNHRAIHSASLKRYSVIVSSMVAFCLRCHAGRSFEYVMPMTPAQKEACQDLRELLDTARRAHTESRSEGSIFGDDIDLTTLLELETDEDEPDGMLKDDMLGVDEGTFCVPELIQPIAITPVQKGILGLLRTLYTQIPREASDGNLFSPLLRFIVLKSLGSDRQWLQARQVTQIIAVFLFCGRQVMMAIMSDVIEKGKLTQFKMAYESVRPFLDEVNEGPIPAMYLLIRPLHQMASSENGAEEFTANDFSGDSVLVNGRVIHFTDIRNFVERVVEEATRIIQEKLLFGLHDVFKSTQDAIYDDLQNTSVRYSCFMDPRNGFAQQQDLLLRTVLSHPKVCGRFHYVDKDGRIVWRPGACYAYMSICHQVEMLLFSGIQLSVGEPGRGTEIASHLISNVAGGTIRNLIVAFGEIGFRGSYNKSSDTTGRDRTMVRVPHRMIGRLFVGLIALVRPLIGIWQLFFSGPAAAFRARDFLFFGPHRAVTSTELSQSLALHTDRLLKCKISIALWRHLATWFINHRMPHPNSKTMLLQAGIQALRAAGQVEQANLPRRLTSRSSTDDSHLLFFNTMLVSAFWHAELGDNRLLHAMNAIKDSETNTHTPFSSDVRRSLTTDIIHAIRADAIPQVISRHQEARETNLGSFRDAAALDLSTGAGPLQPITHFLHPSRLLDLRQFLKDPQARFKDPQQALATELIASRNTSFILIGPTGSGKTLPILLSSSIYDGGNTTVIILPLRAMHTEYQSRASRCRLRCETWMHRSDPSSSPQILLVAVEDCALRSFEYYIRGLICLGRLVRVVIDEAHLLQTHFRFRPCMGQLAYLGQLAVPIILMTATCPQPMERTLFSLVGRTTYQVLRRATERPEIAQGAIGISPYGETQSIEAEAANRISRLMESVSGGDRALLFCWSRDECDEMAELLGWKPYHSSVSLEERERHMQMWRNGETSGLVCTSMLNCCLDYPHVRYVFHLRPPRDAIDYYQAIGRVSRDGKGGTAIIFYDPKILGVNSGDTDEFGRHTIYDMLSNPFRCRRLGSSGFLDGVPLSCIMIPEARICDACQSLLSTSYPKDISFDKSESTMEPINADPTQREIAKRPVDLLSQAAPNPTNNPARLASFGNHFLAAQASLTPLAIESSNCAELLLRAAYLPSSSAMLGSWILCSIRRMGKVGQRSQGAY
ncbi:hypothetical protein BDN71DRAFT_602419 [Pleurotus eryngii]|uniref:DNA 3'-5' helicase n=1 Tax=Pleurotus eryngii TaxID=5323 RepID=A0A9P5ZJC1_PLEER|nr:hypothetical protein BDN71DRAFT_602419 [Pleurotus eryngii]